MLPSSSRVKLNRVALKEVGGLSAEPRRRRLPKSVNLESKTRAETQPASASVPSGGPSEPLPPTSLTGPGCAAATTGEPLESRVDPAAADAGRAKASHDRYPLVLRFKTVLETLTQAPLDSLAQEAL
ncbi:hypothetical protein EYF80_034912 [Liparis tanakae]|uniref:Uncharacterized protein n=1 Tax=Liparis tanakae TaxID=230148 RepID=A0A4Z2GQ96_9TELE|nr:hypothetical protein EYF80_034912 [Liparis tanakae]